MAQSEDAFSVDVVRVPGAVLVTATGELDADTAPVLAHHLDDAVVDPCVLVIDLRAVPFCDSVGLASFIAVVKRGADLRVVGSPQVVRLMRLTGMDRHVVLAASVEDALLPRELNR
ncbi:STAS domain-containing protein [Umezawaea sp.]|uniref:STAS domain-containing protein n=1 Tax=Umezawaea sp. TaxID=1955258 RepID=UPI002ED1A5AB